MTEKYADNLEDIESCHISLQVATESQPFLLGLFSQVDSKLQSCAGKLVAKGHLRFLSPWLTYVSLQAAGCTEKGGKRKVCAERAPQSRTLGLRGSKGH